VHFGAPGDGILTKTAAVGTRAKSLQPSSLMPRTSLITFCALASGSAEIGSTPASILQYCLWQESTGETIRLLREIRAKPKCQAYCQVLPYGSEIWRGG